MEQQLKRSIVMVQVNYAYGNNIFVPYAVGSLQAYAETIPRIRENFQFEPSLFKRDDPSEVIRNMKAPSVVGFSCYLWNWEYNKVLARLIKETYPECMIVFGGTQVPEKSDGFFKQHPYADILVHHEGEFTFAAILEESLNENPRYEMIAGISLKGAGGETIKTTKSERISDLSLLTSPYLAGVFDHLLGKGYMLNVTQETNRGCPYGCTFCDWGGSTFSKFYQVPYERITQEFTWFANNQIEYLFNADANYGILKRDLSLVKDLVKIREEGGGFPRSFRMCTAKKSDDRVFEIASLLNNHGMNKGATLSFQSMDSDTLAVIKRDNIKIEEFDSLMGRYEQEGISTYTELIMGLPGETYESSKRGIDTLFDVRADSVNLYVHACVALPNSEMSDRLYTLLHGIKTVRMPILLAHSTPEPDGIEEYNDVIVETKTMPHKEWLRTYMFYWAIQGLHCLGPLKKVSMFFHKAVGLTYSDFYEKVVEYFIALPESLIGKEILAKEEVLKAAVKGGRLDIVDQTFGNVYWPLEEASFLHFVTNKEQFYLEIRQFVGDLMSKCSPQFPSKVLDDVVAYQSFILKDLSAGGESLALSYNVTSGLEESGDETSWLTESPVQLKVQEGNYFDGDLERYAREVVWYGRRGGSFYHKDITVLPL